jgi:hypothetical protein
MAFGWGLRRAAGRGDLVIGFAVIGFAVFGFARELLRNPDCAMGWAWQARCARYALFAIAA